MLPVFTPPPCAVVDHGTGGAATSGPGVAPAPSSSGQGPGPGLGQRGEAGEVLRGVFSAEEFASAGFYLPKQEARDNVLQVYVRCWYCGVHVDEWRDGDSLVEEHIRHSRKTERVSDASCEYAQFRKQELRWKSGHLVRPRRESSRKEITRDFSSKPSPRHAENEGGEATSSSSGAGSTPRRSKRPKPPPPPPPPPKPKPKGQRACPRAAKPPPPPPKPAAVLAPPSTPPLSAYAVTMGIVDVVVNLE